MHTIRLRGPWEVQPLVQQRGGEPRSEDLPTCIRCQMPADWGGVLGPDFLGTVRYTRTFNCPTNLEAHEHVWLVVEPPRSSGAVRLNGHELGLVRLGESAGRFDITALLKQHNAVEIDVEHLDPGSSAGGLVGEVRLEIEA